MIGLTKQQITRQDFVDNEIYELINRLLPTNKKIEWNIEIIGEIREFIRKEIIKQRIMDEDDFYSFIEC